MNKEFEKFKEGGFSLEIWSGKKVIFHSKKSGLQGLLEFIKKNKKIPKNLVVFDAKVGNAAALLCVYLKAKEVYGIAGSKLAAETLNNFKVKFYFSKTIPNILNKDETGLCPMEKLSLSKTPQEFYRAATNVDKQAY